MKFIATILMCLLFFFVAGVASADVWGLGPTLVGKTTETPRAVTPPVPLNIIGLEAYSLWGPSSGAAMGVTGKRTIGSAMVKDYRIDFRVGVLSGIIESGPNTKGLIGVFGEIEAAKIGGIVVVLRAEGGKLIVNPGFKLNVVSVSF